MAQSGAISFDPSRLDGKDVEEEMVAMLPNFPGRTLDTRDPQKGLVPGSKTTKAVRTNARRGSQVQISLVILSSVILPLIILVWCIMDITRHHTHVLGAGIIDGHLSYTQAKAIDFVCSAGLAPLIMVLLNLLWFSSVRITPIIKQQPGYRGIPLTTLVEVSNTPSGDFNISKFWILLQSKTWRIGLLCPLVFFSGVATKTLSNFIAYEAFSYTAPHDSGVQLQLLDNSYFNAPFGIKGRDSQFEVPTLHLSNFSNGQSSDVAKDITGLLTSLSFENASANLDAEGGYDTISTLTQQFSRLMLLIHSGGDDGTAAEFLQACTESDTPCYFTSIPGTIDLTRVYDAPNYGEFPFVAFQDNTLQAYLGWLYSSEAVTMHTPFGDVVPTRLDSGLGNAGILCTILRQAGFLKYTRSSTRAWNIASSFFHEENKVTRSFVSDWQSILSYQAPGSLIAGFGPALAQSAGSMIDLTGLTTNNSVDWNAYALNYLYASGEIQRMTYEVAGKNSTPDNLYVVDASVSLNAYRITYIPLILIVGLLSLLGAGTIVCAIVIPSRNLTKSGAHRDLDTLRLLVDSIVGLQESAPTMASTGEMSGAELEKWAKGFRVGYLETTEGDETAIRLFRMRG
ncbi:MAG: hypothetical protein M1820_008248 [Bogoriella megaspora]|nr:MAG: hypothetical protein M1820_008248 [Bogoriella megaspora]